MFDTKSSVISRTAARMCMLAALAVLPIAAVDTTAAAQPVDPATGIAVQYPHHRGGGWGNDGWSGRQPGLIFPGFPALPFQNFPSTPWDGPRDYRHGRPPAPSRVCSGSFGSC